MEVLQNSYGAVMHLLLGGPRVTFLNVLPLILGLVMLRAMVSGGLRSTTMRDIAGLRIELVTVLVVVLPFAFAVLGVATLWPVVEGHMRADLFILICALLGVFAGAAPLAMVMIRETYQRVVGAMLTAVVSATLVIILAGAVIDMFAKTERQSLQLRLRKDSLEEVLQ